MTRKNIEGAARRKRELIGSMAVSSLLRAALTAALLLFARQQPGVLRVLALLAAGAELAVWIGSSLAFGQRWKEIEGGEEDAASQY